MIRRTFLSILAAAGPIAGLLGIKTDRKPHQEAIGERWVEVATSECTSWNFPAGEDLKAGDIVYFKDGRVWPARRTPPDGIVSKITGPPDIRGELRGFNVTCTGWSSERPGIR